MSNRILKDIGWQARIRSELGVDEAYLSDAEIDRPEAITVAEANIIERVPSYATLTGDKRVWLEAATVCECAVLLCSSMAARLPRRSEGPHTNIELSIDWEQRRREIEEKRDVFLERITPLTHYSRLLVT